MLGREQLIEVAVSVLIVFAMIGVMAYVGSTYGGDSGTLSPEGGEVLVVVIVGFILSVTVVGVVLAFVMNDPDEDESEVETENAA